MTNNSIQLTESELFELLGHEVRMDVLRVLWDDTELAEYVTRCREPVPFAELRGRSGYEGSGNFDYHLRKLVGTLVTGESDGYLLSPLGRNIMHALDTYATFEYETIEETVLAEPCPFCGGNLAGSYQREILQVECRDCDGLAEDGLFIFVQMESTTTTGLGVEQLLDAGVQMLEHRARSSMQGICWDCQSTLERRFECCENHASTGVCTDCQHRYLMRVDVTCPNCGTAGRGPLLEYAMLVPAVRALFADHRLGTRQVGPWCYRLAALGAVEELDFGDGPLGVTYRFELDDDTVAVRIENRDDIVCTVL